MKNGVIQQVGKPMELYEHPANKFVAGFIGSPQMNFYDVTLTGDKVTFSTGETIAIPASVLSKLDGRQGEMIMDIRGEDIKLDPQSISIYEADKKSAVVENTEVMGNENNLYFTFGGSQTIARVSKYEISGIGDKIDFIFTPTRIHFFDKNTEGCYV